MGESIWSHTAVLSLFRSSADPGEAEEQKDSKLADKTTTTNGSIPKSPDAAKLEELLNSDGDTVLWKVLWGSCEYRCKWMLLDC